VAVRPLLDGQQGPDQPQKTISSVIAPSKETRARHLSHRFTLSGGAPILIGVCSRTDGAAESLCEQRRIRLHGDPVNLTE